MSGSNGHNVAEVDAVLEALPSIDDSYSIMYESELETLPDPNWLIEQLLPETSLCVLFGQPNSGKSFAALDIGLEVAQEHPVIYVAAEGFGGLAKRRAAWYSHHQKEPGQMYFGKEPLRLMNHADVDAFIVTVNHVGAKLVIFDTLAWCMGGGDENSTRDMQIVLAACRRIQHQTGATVLIVHHTVKRGKDERGSSALRGGADVMIELTEHDGLITLSCSKAKDTEPFPDRHLRLMQVETAKGTSCVVMPADMVVQAPDELTQGQRDILNQMNLEIFTDTGMRSGQIIAAVELAPSSIYRTLSQLKGRGLIRQGKKGDPFYITDKGKQLIGL